MKTTDYESIALSNPIDRESYMSVKNNTDYKFRKNSNTFLRTRPINCGSFKGRKKDNLEGQKIGRLFIVGFRAKHGGQSHGRWVCKCDCGNFTVRSGKSLRNPLLERDMCDECYSKVVLNKKYSTIEGVK